MVSMPASFAKRLSQVASRCLPRVGGPGGTSTRPKGPSASWGGRRRFASAVRKPSTIARPTPPTAFTAGQRFRPSARGWTGSSAGDRVIRSPDPHRMARTRGGRWWRAGRIGCIEPNASVAPLCPISEAALFGEKGSAGGASSKPRGWMFRLPLSAVGRATSTRAKAPGAMPGWGSVGWLRFGLCRQGCKAGIKPLAKPRYLFRFAPYDGGLRYAGGSQLLRSNEASLRRSAKLCFKRTPSRGGPPREVPADQASSTPRTIRTESSPGILYAKSRGWWKHSF